MRRRAERQRAANGSIQGARVGGRVSRKTKRPQPAARGRSGRVKQILPSGLEPRLLLVDRRTGRRGKARTRRNLGLRVEPPKAQFATSPSVKSRPINASRQAQARARVQVQEPAQAQAQAQAQVQAQVQVRAHPSAGSVLWPAPGRPSTEGMYPLQSQLGEPWSEPLSPLMRRASRHQATSAGRYDFVTVYSAAAAKVHRSCTCTRSGSATASITSSRFNCARA